MSISLFREGWPAVFGILFLLSSPCLSQVDSTQSGIRHGLWHGQQITYHDGFICVKLRASTDSQSIKSLFNGFSAELVRHFNHNRWSVIRLKGKRDVLQVIDSLLQNPIVEIAEPRGTGGPDYTPNDPDSAYQWPLYNSGQQPTGGTPGADIKARAAWDITRGNSNVLVAILDSGIPYDTTFHYLTHPDLSNTSRFILGPVFTLAQYDSDRTVRDSLGHGTHVLGIAGAETNNSTGIAGIASGCKFLIMKVFGTAAQAFTPDGLADAIEAAADSGARVLNFSGHTGDYSQVREAIQYAGSLGALLVVSAGNEGSVQYPAKYSLSYPNVVAVGATDQNDVVAGYSGKGSALCVTAPGGYGAIDSSSSSDDGKNPPPLPPPNQAWGIFSTLPNYPNGIGVQNYGWLVGTSMAAPHVTGIAALMLSVNPNLTPLQLRNYLDSTADDKGATGFDTVYGWGRVNAYRALRMVMTRPFLSSPVNGVTISMPQVLCWFAPVGANSYRLQVATDSNFTSRAIDTSGIADTSYTVTCLMLSTRYYWRVDALVNNDTTSWSDTRNFKTQTPLLVSPANCATLSNSLTLTWASFAGASSYRLQVATDSNFSNRVEDTSGITDTSSVVNGLSNMATYFWHVCPRTCGDSSHWSATGYFHTSPPQPAQLTGSSVKWMRLGELVASPQLSWADSNWCNLTFALYKYDCTTHHGCPDTVGTCIYSGTSNSYIDSSWFIGDDTTHVRHYYVKATATQTGQSSNSNKVSYDGPDIEKRGFVYNDSPPALPKAVALEGNYPEPFNPTTTIRYALPATMEVRLTVYNILGQDVKNLVDETEGAGYKSAIFDASSLSSGIYFYRLEAVDVNNRSHTFVQARKMLLLK